MKTKKSKEKKIGNPKHDCPVFGKDAIVPRAHNTAYPDKIYYKCPFCYTTIEELE